MEEPGEDGLDGSSIKPVSSLRSHFEQMGVGKPGKIPPPRPVSPKPMINMAASSNGDIFKGSQGQYENMLAPVGGLHPERGREREIGENAGLRNLRAQDLASSSPSPTRNSRLHPLPAAQSPLPAVNVLPPQSPPKSRVPHLSLANSSTFLSTDAPPSSTGTNSPRNFKIPSRPHTPMIDSARSPKLSPSRPPSPPPPRRSGEMRRDTSMTFKPPPPINRSEKPKIASKPMALSVTEVTTLAPRTPQPASKQTSPFNTPPSNSPEREVSPPALPGSRPRVVVESTAVNLPGHKTFEPPPLHHSVVSKRRDLDTNGTSRGPLTPQFTGDERPNLPSRLSVSFDPPKLRSTSTAMMPPPPRPADKKKPAVNVAAPIETSYATPPKRVFSTPTTQSQTPPRSHGRSMTVDRTSNKTPVEFRAPLTVIPKVEPRASLDIAPTTSIKEPLQLNLGDYPDASNTNRRPPYFKQGVRDISVKYDTRIMDVCGEYVCTSGLMTRVWSLITGEVIMSIVHVEGIKILSVAFKPAADVEDEGKRLWLGNNVGELIEVDVATSSLITSKASAHTRRDIIKIYRHLNEMWTLDDGGTLHLWAPNNAGEPTLSNPHQSFRVPKGHTFSMVVVDELWHATGKELRVFVPTVDLATQFQVLARPLTQPNTGEITCGTVVKSRPENVYFGHTDGKVTIYSRRDYSCLGIVNISVYKVTSLAGVNGRLWAGFSTGMVYVYDIEVSPWAVKKEWQAHHNGLVVKMIADPGSCWSLDREQVVSLGLDNVLRVWDGTMQDDWIENQMQAEEESFCELKPIKTLVMTWNAGASTPYHLQHSPENQNFFRDLLQSSDGPDILVFGFQELVDLEDKKTTAKSFFKSKKKDDSDQQHMSHQYRDWRDFLTRCLDDFMPRNELYHLLHTASLVGLFTCIFVRAPLRDRIRSISGAEVKRGMGGLHGNKGALVLRFVLDDTSLCFINCHLAAGLSQTKDRNADITAILETPLFPTERDMSVRQDIFVSGGDGSLIMDHEICILNGDLNYRIDTMGRDTVVNAIKANNLSKLLERDQLLASKRKNPWFKLRAFQELPITFAPTYKYDVGTDNYDTSEKKRAPAWCDRLLYRGQSRIRQLTYRRHEVRVSDHRPVTGLFEIIIKTISPKKRALKWDECQARLSELKVQQGDHARLEYLMNVLGFSHAECMKMIAERKARSR